MRLLSIVLVLVLYRSAAAQPKPAVEPCLDDETCLARCARNVATACVRAGELALDRRAGERDAAMVAKLDTALGKLCQTSKDARACVVGGDLHCTDAGCTPTAASHWKMGCQLGDGASCAFLGTLALRGFGGEPKDPARAQSLFARAWTILDDECSDGSAHACMELGVYRADARFGAPDKAVATDGLRRGVPLLARDCRAGDARACMAVAFAYTHGLGVKASYVRADAAELAMCKLAPKSSTCTLDPNTPGGQPGPTNTAPQHVVVGQPTATGNLDKAPPIRRMIRRRLPAIAYCYDRELPRQRTLAGTVTLKFTIEANGKVSAMKASGLPPVDACVGDVVKAIEFPPLPQRIDVTYPFVFQPPPPKP